MTGDQHRGRIAAGTTHQGPKPCDQLCDRERLRQVVVGPEIQRPDPIIDGIERSEDQHGRARAGLAKILEQRPPALLRHHQVEDDRVIAHLFEHELRLLAVGDDIHSEVGFVQGPAQRAAKIGLVLDNEHPHRLSPDRPDPEGPPVFSSMRTSSNITVVSPELTTPIAPGTRGWRSRSVITRIPPR